MIDHSLMIKGDLRAAAVREWLERPLDRLERRLSSAPEGSARLRIALRAACHKRQALATLELDVIDQHLAVSEEHPDARLALQDAFAELERRLDRELGRRRARQRSRRCRGRLGGEILDGLVPWPLAIPRAQPAL